MMRFRWLAVVAIVVAGLVPRLALAQQTQQTEVSKSYPDKAAALIEPYVQSGLFSGSVLVARDGQVLFRKSFGLANREWDIANAPETKFRIGSVTKQITAAAILQLAERGKLKLDDPISQYDPDAPAAWRKITIKHLLTHSSGIANYTSLPDFMTKMARVDRTPGEIVQLVRNEPLEFEPGTQFAYSNTGYVLLGMIIEKVSGQGYYQYLQDNIFGPMGMTSTGYDDIAAIIPRRASGYKYSGKRWDNADYFSTTDAFGAGALLSTVDDMLVWVDALSAGKVLNGASLDAMFSDYGHQYGFGWFVRKRFDRVLRTHGGGINGFRADVESYPADKLTVIVLSNLESAPVDRIGYELAALQFGVAPERQAEAVSIAPALLDGYVGFYQVGPKFVVNISREGDRLFAQATKQPKLEIFPESDKAFFYKVVSARLTFEGDAQGRITGLVLHQNGNDLPGRRIDEAEARRIEQQQPKQHKEAAVDPKVFDGLSGRYQLNKTFILTITREGDRLFAQATNQPKLQIFPEGARDYFYKVVDAQLTFDTDDQGRARSLVLHQNGLDLPAPRID